ncbi:hypothetical protein ABH942_001140 [Flavobacterium sp. 28YEA47A]
MPKHLNYNKRSNFYTSQDLQNKKSLLNSGGFFVYACPAGPKFKGIGGCSVSFISPWALS